MPFKTKFDQIVAWGDMDAFGHVNNTVYLKYFESARVRYFESVPELAGFDGPVIPVLAKIECQFLKAVSYPDTLQIQVGVSHLGTASMRMECEMYSQHHGLSAKASCTIVMIDAVKKHSVRIPEPWKEAIIQIEGTLK